MEVMTIKDCIELAVKAHINQWRKITNMPYIVHPLRVSEMAYTYGQKEIYKKVGLLHDVLEDSTLDIPDPDLKILVEGLSLTKKDKARIKRTGESKSGVIISKIDTAVTGHENKMICVGVKLCDRLDNLLDMNRMDESFQTRYKTESIELLDGIDLKFKFPEAFSEVVDNIIEICKD